MKKRKGRKYLSHKKQGETKRGGQGPSPSLNLISYLKWKVQSGKSGKSGKSASGVPSAFNLDQ